MTNRLGSSGSQAQEVVVGVSGHRFLAEPELVTAGVEAAISRIEQVFGQPLTILSSLAEGADRLVVWRTLNRPLARLKAVMPLPEDHYLQDFRSDESRREFSKLLNRAVEVVNLDPKPTREEAYEAAGDYVVQNSRILIAVWDGQVELGRGGTGEVVNRARLRRMPIAWVHAGNRKPGTNEPISLGSQQGSVSFENF